MYDEIINSSPTLRTKFDALRQVHESYRKEFLVIMKDRLVKYKFTDVVRSKRDGSLGKIFIESHPSTPYYPYEYTFHILKKNNEYHSKPQYRHGSLYNIAEDYEPVILK